MATRMPGIMAQTPQELATRLKKPGLKETKATFPATFFLACIAALELDGLALEGI